MSVRGSAIASPAAWVWDAWTGTRVAVGASPAPDVLTTLDTRTTDAPSSIGGPLEVLVAVVLLGLATVLLTAGWVKVRDRDSP
jgi:hypothetical protein